MPQASINITSSGDNTVIALESGIAYSISKIFLAAYGAVTITFKSGSTDLSGPLQFQARERLFIDESGRDPWFIVKQGEAFIINLSAGVQVSGTVIYRRSHEA